MTEQKQQAVLQREVVVKNKLGMHARAAALFRECASKYKSEITVIKNHMRANAKSLLGLIALGAPQGTKLTVTASGEDAEAALDALEQLVNTMFEEEHYI